MFQNHNQIVYRKMMIMDELKLIQQQESILPEGELLCRKNSTRYKWYSKTSKGTCYLPKDKKELAEKLALKRYFSVKTKELKEELNACNAYLLESVKEPMISSRDIFNHPEYNRLLEKQIRVKDQELQSWMEKDYIKNMDYSEELTVKASRGRKVRSKSEATIDHALFMAGIPFHYEEKLTLHGSVIYPDFTIRHPVTGSYYYWEHFGIMDDMNYIRKTANKIKLYSENGIVPMINLITTYETKENPLDMEFVDKMIEYFFR